MIRAAKSETEDTPSGLGYSMPAEWERHRATWLSWPKNELTFPRSTLGRVEETYLEMIEALSAGERVELLVDDQRTEDVVRSRLSSSRNVFFHQLKSMDVWVRDYGPLFVRRGPDVAATKWHFNAWGGKYDDLLADDRTGRSMADSAGLRVFTCPMVLEGGSIDVNGAGGCITTRQCLLNANRNPRLSIEEIAANLRAYLGVRRLVWLERGIEGDDTDGHIDDVARFVSEYRVVCMTEADEGDGNFTALKSNESVLTEAAIDDRELDVISLQMPRRVGEGERLPASYANFYISNSVVLLPIFGDTKNDDRATSTLSGLFKGRRVVPIDCRALVNGFGGIHCVTQQQPSGV